MKAVQCANFFILKSKENYNHPALTHYRLQKLLYIANGWSLALDDMPLFEDPIKVWPYGPIINEIYHLFKACAAEPITSLATWFNYNSDEDNKEEIIPGPCFGSREYKLLSRVWEVYCDCTDDQLANYTHADDGPWSQVLGLNLDMSPLVIPGHSTIPNFRIKAWFVARKASQKIPEGEALITP